MRTGRFPGMELFSWLAVCILGWRFAVVRPGRPWLGPFFEAYDKFFH